MPNIAGMTKQKAPRLGKPRTVVIALRVPPEERNRIEAAAIEQGLSISGYIAATLTAATRGERAASRPDPNEPELPIEPPTDESVLQELRRIGNNINQIARAANCGLPLSDLKALEGLQAILASMTADTTAPCEAAPAIMNLPISAPALVPDVRPTPEPPIIKPSPIAVAVPANKPSLAPSPTQPRIAPNYNAIWEAEAKPILAENPDIPHRGLFDIIQRRQPDIIPNPKQSTEAWDSFGLWMWWWKHKNSSHGKR